MRFIIYSPKERSYVEVNNRGWTSGHLAHEVHHYGSYEEAENVINTFHSLKQCKIIGALVIIELNPCCTINVH